MAKATTKPPTKTEVFTSIAEVTGLSKRDVSAVFDALNDQIKKALAGRGGSTVGEPLPNALSSRVRSSAAERMARSTRRAARFSWRRRRARKRATSR